MHEDWNDERLMLAYRDGDAGAFEALYRRYRGSLHRYLTHQCGSPASAEELYQDIWLKVINARADYEPLARFSTWIFRIAHHRLIDHYRKSAPEIAARYETRTSDDGLNVDADDLIASQPAPLHETPHELHDRRATAQRINLALADLPAPQREAFLLAEEGGLTLEEIGTSTAVSRETSKSRLRYALSKLRHSLQDLL
jgi:RNA polymerase sigma-70 factor (ECF subfamily)